MIYIVTPVHNRKEITRAFLECLRNQRFRDFRTIIIDDGSTDGTSEMVAQTFADVTLLRGDGNLWWTGATNAGLSHVLEAATDDDYVLIINDDVLIGPDYLERLVYFARSHPDSLIGSVVVDVHDPTIIIDGGSVWNWRTAKHTFLNRGVPLSSFSASAFYEVSTLTGRGMLAPVSVFRDIGVYDDRRFKHRGDTELPVRASRKGYRLIVYYGAVVQSHSKLTDVSETHEYCLRDLKRYFFDFRSSGSLCFRYNFARATARSPLQFLSFLVCDIARVTLHFFRRCDYTRIRSHPQTI